mmetsp:Transcript_22581/g.54557  ORF Transcript_22581/g.54557 Transcript_22581/m.54557 type:complete len:206 (+) Transcript_22581:136-753(+)
MVAEFQLIDVDTQQQKSSAAAVGGGTASSIAADDTTLPITTTTPLENADATLPTPPPLRCPHPSEWQGRWILVHSEISAPVVFDSGVLIITHQKNAITGEDEYVSTSTLKLRIRCLPCITFPIKEHTISRMTGGGNFRTYSTKNGTIEYGRVVEGNKNKYVTVGKKGTNEIVFDGDKCYMKNVDARYSLYTKQEWRRVGESSDGS